MGTGVRDGGGGGGGGAAPPEIFQRLIFGQKVGNTGKIIRFSDINLGGISTGLCARVFYAQVLLLKISPWGTLLQCTWGKLLHCSCTQYMGYKIGLKCHRRILLRNTP